MNSTRAGQVRYRRKPAPARKPTARGGSVATRAGKAVQDYLRSHPDAAKLTVALKNGKVAVTAPRPARQARIAPPGFFDAIYTKDVVAADNALAKVSVIDPADFDA